MTVMLGVRVAKDFSVNWIRFSLFENVLEAQVLQYFKLNNLSCIVE